MINTYGDVIEFDGYIVGRIRADIPATVRDRLDDALKNAAPAAPEKEAEPPFISDESSDELARRFRAAAQGGFLTVAEALDIVANVGKGA